MIDEKKIARAAMNEDELDKVAGGTFDVKKIGDLLGAFGEYLKNMSEEDLKKLIDQKNQNNNSQKV